MIVYIVMKQSKQFSDSATYIKMVYASEEKANAYVKLAIEKDKNNWYYVDDREVLE
jgi:hypothetical protein